MINYARGKALYFTYKNDVWAVWNSICQRFYKEKSKAGPFILLLLSDIAGGDLSSKHNGIEVLIKIRDDTTIITCSPSYYYGCYCCI